MTRGKKMTIKEQTDLIAKDPSFRKQIFADLLQHIEAGYSLDCFHALSDNTIHKYLKDYPLEFVEEDLIRAMRKAKSMWEGIGHRQAIGTCLGNSRSWYYNMSNRYGWQDKVDLKAEHSGSVAVSIVSYADTIKPKQ